MPEEKLLQVKPSVVFRENFDDMAVVYDPEGGKAFGLNPVGVIIWQLLDGKHTLDQIVDEVIKRCTQTPDNLKEHVWTFISSLLDSGLIGYVSRR